MRLRGRVVTPDGVLENATVRVEGDRIAAVTTGVGGRPDLRSAWIVPGFVDMHCHGGGGYTFTTGDVEQARGAVDFHRCHGTTTMLASLVTASRRDTLDQTTALAELVHSGEIAGIHLEGPYLSTARCGAQNPAYLRDPSTEELSDLIALGVVRSVTIAPELPGALDAIALLRTHDVTAAVGHTDATYEQALDAVRAGATLATHLCNAMRPIHHRDPGPIIALLESTGVVCETIADGVHLHDAMLRHIARVAGPDRVALVTDAIAAAGMDDGAYSLGGQEVNVTDGVARLPTSGTIAGSTLTMTAAFRRAVQSGVSIVDVARMASTTPARVLGLAGEVGAIAPGRRADIALLDEDLRVNAVLHHGTIVTDVRVA